MRRRFSRKNEKATPSLKESASVRSVQYFASEVRCRKGGTKSESERSPLQSWVVVTMSSTLINLLPTSHVKVNVLIERTQSCEYARAWHLATPAAHQLKHQVMRSLKATNQVVHALREKSNNFLCCT